MSSSPTMTRERVVIDTNVLISSLFFATSTPALAVDKAVTNAQLVATRATLREPSGRVRMRDVRRHGHDDATLRRCDERHDAAAEQLAVVVDRAWLGHRAIVRCETKAHEIGRRGKERHRSRVAGQVVRTHRVDA